MEQEFIDIAEQVRAVLARTPNLTMEEIGERLPGVDVYEGIGSGLRYLKHIGLLRESMKAIRGHCYQIAYRLAPTRKN